MRLAPSFPSTHLLLLLFVLICLFLLVVDSLRVHETIKLSASTGHEVIPNQLYFDNTSILSTFVQFDSCKIDEGSHMRAPFPAYKSWAFLLSSLSPSRLARGWTADNKHVNVSKRGRIITCKSKFSISTSLLISTCP